MGNPMLDMVKSILSDLGVWDDMGMVISGAFVFILGSWVFSLLRGRA